jgi:hypothetical protein
MFNSLHHKNVSCLAVAGTATSVSLAACGEGRARKKNKIMQNEPNLKNDRIYTSTCDKGSYGNLIAFFRRKNEAKRTQNEPNFSPKLGSFSSILASVSTIMAINCWQMFERSLNEDY